MAEVIAVPAAASHLIKEPWRERFQRWKRLFSIWFFGDIAYAILPIVILAFIKLVGGERFTGFFLIKEWSFATIVFFGITIRRLIRLNADAPLSYKLDSGVQLFIFLLIAAVVVLSFVTLTSSEGRISSASGWSSSDEIVNVNKTVLTLGQISLFLLGLLSVWFVTMSEERLRLRHAKLPKDLGKTYLLRHIGRQFDRAYDLIWYINFAVDRLREETFVTAAGDVRDRREQQKRARDLLAAVQLLQELTDETRANITTLSESHEIA